jgi:hypothetical protein
MTYRCTEQILHSDIPPTWDKTVWAGLVRKLLRAGGIWKSIAAVWTSTQREGEAICGVYFWQSERCVSATSARSRFQWGASNKAPRTRP